MAKYQTANIPVMNTTDTITASDPILPVNVVLGSFSLMQPNSNTASAPAQQAVGTSSVSILPSNAARKGCTVVNTGTTIIYIGLGQTPTATAYHIALRACGVANDGSSERWDGTISGVNWLGAINAIGSASGGTVVVTELT